jgi:hypothetical protein
MLRKRPIDEYIYRATLGLPKHNRVDTSAELRVHLNSRVKELMASGFPKDESEHLAVQEMGRVEPVNLAFLGHGFTNKLGWLVLCAALLAGIYYFFFQKIENNFRQTMLDGKDFALILANNKLENPDYSKFVVDVPQNVVQVQWALVSGGVFNRLDLTREKLPAMNSLGEKATVLVGFGTPKINIKFPCKTAAQMIVYTGTPGYSVSRFSQLICLFPTMKPSGPTGDGISSSSFGDSSKINLDTWTPAINWNVDSDDEKRHKWYVTDITKHAALIVKLAMQKERGSRIEYNPDSRITTYHFVTENEPQKSTSYHFAQNSSGLWTLNQIKTGK